MTASLTRFLFIIKFMVYYILFFHIAEVLCQNPFENQQFDKQSTPAPNKYQEPYEAQLPNEAQEPYEAQLPNEAQEQFLTLQQGVQILNNLQLPNIDQLLNDVYLLNGSLNPFENGILSPLTDIKASTFTNELKKFQNTFFDDLENDARMSIKSGLNPNISLECLKSLADLQVGLVERKRWAIRMIDSFGKIPSGLLDGTIRAYGDFDMCVDTVIPDFQGRYCLVNVSVAGGAKRIPIAPMNLSYVFNRDYSKPLPTFDEVSSLADILLTTSICLPSKCSESDIQNILLKVTSYGLQSIDLVVKDCTIKPEIIFNSTQKTIIFVILAVILFEVFATFLDVRLRNLYGEQFNEEKLSKTVQCILAFSYYSNSIRLFKKNENPDSVKIFQGMKFITMAWIVWAHMAFSFLLMSGRMYDVFMLFTGPLLQIPSNGYVGTETFFFMSGFLIVHTYVKRNCPRHNFIIFVFYRYIRLMPPFFLILGCLLLSENLGSGPIWKELITGYLVGACRESWWKNMFLFNNTSGLFGSCLPWTWYIAVEMHLYMFSYLILLVIRRNPKRALLILKVIIVANVIGLMFYYAAYNLPPSPILIYINLLDVSYFTKLVHFGTYNHITPYCVGMIMGYYIATKKKIHFSKTKKLLGWCVSTFFFLFGLFGTYVWNHNGRIATATESALFGGFQRLSWSIMLSWVIYLCLNGEADKVKSILSADIFVPLSRLTYGAYLVHPLIQLLMFGQMKYLIFPEMILLIYFTLGFIVISYMLAYGICLISEAPVSRLLSILINGKLGKSDKKSK